MARIKLMADPNSEDCGRPSRGRPRLPLRPEAPDVGTVFRSTLIAFTESKSACPSPTDLIRRFWKGSENLRTARAYA